MRKVMLLLPNFLFSNKKTDRNPDVVWGSSVCARIDICGLLIQLCYILQPISIIVKWAGYRASLLSRLKDRLSRRSCPIPMPRCRFSKRPASNDRLLVIASSFLIIFLIVVTRKRTNTRRCHSHASNNVLRYL